MGTHLIRLVLLHGLLSVALSATAGGTDSPRWTERTAPIFRLVASQTDDDARMPYTAEPFALAQDATGFIWIGTTTGLERWDGYRMRLYSARPGDPCALQDERVSTMYVDERQRLWIGTLRGDVALYDPQTDCIRAVGGTADVRNRALVEAITSDGEGGVWIGSRSGLRHLASDLTHWMLQGADTSDEQRLSHERVTRVLRDRRGVLWVGGNMGLARRGPSDAHFVGVPLPSDARVRALIESSDGRIWVGTVANGAYVIDPSTLRARSVMDILRRDPIPLLFRAAETPTGEIWFATTSAGIIAVDPVSLRTRVIHHQKGVPLSLVDDSVQDLLRDRAGLMWVVTDAGLGYFNTVSDVSTILIADDLNGLPEGQITSTVRMADDRIALAFGNQIAIIGPRGSGAEKVPLNLRPGAELVLSLATLNGRDLFAAVLPNGLAWVDRAAGRASYVPLPGPSVAQHVHALLADGERLWVGGLEGLWLVVHRTDGDRSPIPWSVARRFDVGDIESMAIGTGDVRWFGSERGIFRYALGSAAPSHVQLLNPSGAALPDPIVSSLHSDRSGRLWIGSNSEGLVVIDPSTASEDRVHVLRHFLGDLPGTSVRSILEDERGGVWVGTTRGIAHIDPQTFKIRRIGRGDGNAIVNYATAACATQVCDELLFGGKDGLTLIHPTQNRAPLRPPPVVVTRISVGRQEVPSTRFNTSAVNQVLDVPADARSLAVEFATLDYSDPSHNAYEYRLDGYDSDWVPSGFDSRMALYTNLLPGTYRLRLRGSDHAGVWSADERQFIVEVAPAWYQMMWFHLVEAGGFAMAVLLIVRARTAILRQRQRELEILVDERTQALVDATQSRNRLIENLAHDLRTPLTSLRGYLDRLNLNDEALSDIERNRYIEIAVRQAERLIRLVRELFELVRLDDPLARLALERFTPAEILQDVAQEFGSIAEGRSIDIEVDPGVESVQITGDISLFQRLIDNLVDNAMRHTPAGGKITVKLSTGVGVIVLEVRDTGRGISSADRERIFNRYERGAGMVGVSGAGLGLAIVKRILELHRGSIIVDSEVGVGTGFTVHLPLGGPESTLAGA